MFDLPPNRGQQKDVVTVQLLPQLRHVGRDPSRPMRLFGRM
jgi:hypothetical protein